MEENKTKVQGGSPAKLPGIDIQYRDRQEEKERQQPLLPSRISKTLTDSIILTAEKLDNKFHLTAVNNEEVREAVDEKGKLRKLSAKQKRILLALQYQLSLLKDRKEVKEYIDAIENGGNPPHPVTTYINLEELCERVCGEEEKTKKREQEALKEELKELSCIKQLLVYDIEYFNPETKNRETVRVKAFQPYLYLTGKEVEIEKGKRTSKAIEICFSRIFLERIRDRYIPVYPSFWQSTKSDGKKIKTDHHQSLATLAISYGWAHYHKKLPEARKYIKKENILDTEKQAKIIEAALTHEPVPFGLLKDIIKGKTEERSEKLRFKGYLWEAMWSLINYGLLSPKSHIDWEGETFTLVYNPDYYTQITNSLPPSGEWSKNPFKK